MNDAELRIMAKNIAGFIQNWRWTLKVFGNVDLPSSLTVNEAIKLLSYLGEELKKVYDPQ